MTTSSYIAPVRRWSAWLLRIVRNALVLSVPFGLFFGLFQHRAYWQGALICYAISIAISISVSVFVQAAEELYCRLFPNGQNAHGRQLVIQMAMFGVTGVVGSQVPMILLSRFGGIEMYGNWRGGLINIGFSLVFTTLFMGVVYARVFYVRMREREAAELAARAELATARLAALRAQVHPHFLFNTLNTIAALIPQEPAVAEEVTTRLAEVFRFVLQAGDRDWVMLAEEIAFVRAYLDIEMVRLGDRLRVDESWDTASLSVPVPTLLLQPLVENAVRHGIGPRAGGGRVTLGSRLEGDVVVLTVRDDGVGFDAVGRHGRAGTGFGLRSAEERVKALGAPAAMTIDSAPGAGTTVTVRLARRGPADGSLTPPAAGGRMDIALGAPLRATFSPENPQLPFSGAAPFPEGDR